MSSGRNVGGERVAHPDVRRRHGPLSQGRGRRIHVHADEPAHTAPGRRLEEAAVTARRVEDAQAVGRGPSGEQRLEDGVEHVVDEGRGRVEGTEALAGPDVDAARL